MRIAMAAAAAALLGSSPSFATSGLRCTPVAGKGPALDLIIGHGAGSAVVSARLGGQALSIAQSWIDSRYVWLDLTDAPALRYEAKLRAVFQPRLKGRPAVGTLVRNGRTYRVRCVEA